MIDRGRRDFGLSSPVFKGNDMEENKEMSVLQAQEMLAQVLNNTPTEIEVAGEIHSITALKLGTMNLIAEESCKIQKAQDGNMLDIYRQFAKSIPAVIKCLCYAILNDKTRIFSDYTTRTHSEEYQALYEKLEWESDRKDWMSILVEVMNKIDISFFINAASTLTMIRESSLMTRKRKAA